MASSKRGYVLAWCGVLSPVLNADDVVKYTTSIASDNEGGTIVITKDHLSKLRDIRGFDSPRELTAQEISNTSPDDPTLIADADLNVTRGKKEVLERRCFQAGIIGNNGIQAISLKKCLELLATERFLFQSPQALKDSLITPRQTPGPVDPILRRAYDPAFARKPVALQHVVLAKHLGLVDKEISYSRVQGDRPPSRHHIVIKQLPRYLQENVVIKAGPGFYLPYPEFFDYENQTAVRETILNGGSLLSGMHAVVLGVPKQVPLLAIREMVWKQGGVIETTITQKTSVAIVGDFVSLTLLNTLNQSKVSIIDQNLFVAGLLTASKVGVSRLAFGFGYDSLRKEIETSKEHVSLRLQSKYSGRVLVDSKEDAQDLVLSMKCKSELDAKLNAWKENKPTQNVNSNFEKAKRGWESEKSVIEEVNVTQKKMDNSKFTKTNPKIRGDGRNAQSSSECGPDLAILSILSDDVEDAPLSEAQKMSLDAKVAIENFDKKCGIDFMSRSESFSAVKKDGDVAVDKGPLEEPSGIPSQPEVRVAHRLTKCDKRFDMMDLKRSSLMALRLFKDSDIQNILSANKEGAEEVVKLYQGPHAITTLPDDCSDSGPTKPRGKKRIRVPKAADSKPRKRATAACKAKGSLRVGMKPNNDSVKIAGEPEVKTAAEEKRVIASSRFREPDAALSKSKKRPLPNDLNTAEIKTKKRHVPTESTTNDNPVEVTGGVAVKPATIPKKLVTVSSTPGERNTAVSHTKKPNKLMTIHKSLEICETGVKTSTESGESTNDHQLRTINLKIFTGDVLIRDATLEVPASVVPKVKKDAKIQLPAKASREKVASRAAVSSHSKLHYADDAEITNHSGKSTRNDDNFCESQPLKGPVTAR